MSLSATSEVAWLCRRVTALNTAVKPLLHMVGTKSVLSTSESYFAFVNGAAGMTDRHSITDTGHDVILGVKKISKMSRL